MLDLKSDLDFLEDLDFAVPCEIEGCDSEAALSIRNLCCGCVALTCETHARLVENLIRSARLRLATLECYICGKRLRPEDIEFSSIRKR